MGFATEAFDSEVLVAVLIIVPALVAVGTSIYAGRRIARRLAMRPPKSRPNLSSVTLTILFASIFFLAQACIGFCVFFCGCLAMMSFHWPADRGCHFVMGVGETGTEPLRE